MEAVGLALGVVGLAGACKSCLDLFSCFASQRSLGRDYEILDAKLQVEKALLLQWAQRVRLLEENYDQRLDDPVTSQAVSCILASIQHLLSESTALKERYGLQPTRKGQETRLSMINNARMERLTRDFNVMKLRMRQRQENVSRSARLYWIIADKEKFNELIQELSHFVSRLTQVFQDSEPRQDRNLLKDMMREDLASVWDFKVMQLIREATSERGDPVAEVAEERILEISQRAVLDLIWFRSMDDRKDSVDPPHSETFEWAMRPPHSEVEWDDLSQWLRSGSGMYWISGKAGSGKSTLTKYLSEHRMTADLLKEWAGSFPLSICSFYFWNLGTAEQRSQEGLSKAVLFQLLHAEPSLIPALLPRSWEEINKSKGDRPNPPSKAELAAACGMISSGYNLKRRFCFFIDGLDEYVGNYLDGVIFVQRLYKNPHIKVIVSSRPIPICVDSFSSGPMLRLEDLTRSDISAYVQDTVGSHPYLERLLESGRVVVHNLLRQLIEKASGVFLWVVLACRSVLDGFAAYDRIEELQRRVDHLPPELEALFQHMLDQVDHRYHEQMAKMLRICYMRQIDSDHPVA
ncbi:HeLo domain-containing protein [Fusarium keratoplasticum]|nr:HeLo domain-containing protein [Fusarium keratoplasticum]